MEEFSFLFDYKFDETKLRLFLSDHWSEKDSDLFEKDYFGRDHNLLTHQIA